MHIDSSQFQSLTEDIHLFPSVTDWEELNLQNLKNTPTPLPQCLVWKHFDSCLMSSHSLTLCCCCPTPTSFLGSIGWRLWYYGDCNNLWLLPHLRDTCIYCGVSTSCLLFLVLSGVIWGLWLNFVLLHLWDKYNCLWCRKWNQTETFQCLLGWLGCFQIEYTYPLSFVLLRISDLRTLSQLQLLTWTVFGDCRQGQYVFFFLYNVLYLLWNDNVG